MISFDFEYCRPDTAEEAHGIFKKLAGSGKKPVYYGGGTEIISLSRSNQMEYNAVIDLKSILDCNVMAVRGSEIILGAALPLTQICETDIFPFFTDVARRAADHTSRNRITLGGNIASSLPYKEASMPLLVCDAEALVSGSQGKRRVPVQSIFDQTIQLNNDDFFVQFIIDSQYKSLTYKSIKRTRHGELEYPLVSAAAIKKEGKIRFSFSGICPQPFRSTQIENDLNNARLPSETRIANAIAHLPQNLMDDILGSAEYRKFVLANTLRAILDSLEGVG
jgi:CO/xanthine dehydrogenase FAD-binding subunit